MGKRKKAAAGRDPTSSTGVIGGYGCWIHRQTFIVANASRTSALTATAIHRETPTGAACLTMSNTRGCAYSRDPALLLALTAPASCSAEIAPRRARIAIFLPSSSDLARTNLHAARSFRAARTVQRFQAG